MARITFNRKGIEYGGDINGDIYNRAYAGNALTVLFMRQTQLPTDPDPKNIIARGSSYNYRETYQVLPVLEWDTYFIQEIVIGMQDLGTFGVGLMYTLRNNDSLPTVKTLPWESEMLVLQAVGRDSPNNGMILNAWYGARFTGRGSGMNVNGIVTDEVNGVYRYRLTGKDYAYVNRTFYPGDLKEVNMSFRDT